MMRCRPAIGPVEIICFCGSLLVLGGGVRPARALTVAADGRARATIVIPERPSAAAKSGAKVLADHLQLICGAVFRVVTERDLADASVENGRVVLPSGAMDGKAFILVGEGDLARRLGATSEGLGPGGILIRTFPNALVLLGPDDRTPSDPWGTRYAVLTFLDEVLGCRYLWPGELGKIVPRSKTIEIPPLERTFTPALRQRYIRNMRYNARLQIGLDKLGFSKEDYLGSPISQTADWFVWQRLGGRLGVRGGDGTILPAELWQKWLKEHPEWFAMQLDGSREQAPGEKRPRLCVSNPDLIKAIVRVKLDELRKHPDWTSVSLDVHDGGRTGFCMCPACKALDPPEGPPTRVWTYDHAKGTHYWFDYVSLSDRMAYFYNAIAEGVAKERPDVLFGASAYSAYSAPPLRRKLHPSIVIRFVGIHYFSEKLRKKGLAAWDGWRKAASKMYFRPNLLLAARREGTPVVYVHKLARDFNYLAHHGMIGTDFDSCCHNWATQGLNYYVCARLNWNPDLDVNELIDDYCRKGFGPAAESVKAYLMRIEELTDIMAEKEMGITEPYTPEVLAELRGYLDAAGAAAGGDPVVRRRIAFLRRGLEFTELQARAYRMLALVGKRRLTDGEKAEAKRLLDERWIMMRRMFTEQPLAVNVAYVCWGEGRRFARLGWSGPDARLRETVEADEHGRPIKDQGR